MYLATLVLVHFQDDEFFNTQKSVRYSNNENVWNITSITKTWHRDTILSNAVAEMAQIKLLEEELPETFNL